MPTKKRKSRTSRMSQKALAELMQSETVFQRNVETAGTGIKPFMRAKQIYHERIVLGDGILNPYPYKFMLNSTFDPNETGTGHQPRGRDALAAIYNDYSVLSAKWKVEFLTTQSADSMRGWVHVDTNSNSDITSAQDALERGKAVKSVFIRGSSEDVLTERGVLSGSVDMKKHMITGDGSFADQFSAGVGANPALPVRLHIQVQDEDYSVIPNGACICYVTIEYDVVYTTPISAAFAS